MHTTLDDDDWVMVDLITAPTRHLPAQDPQHASKLASEPPKDAKTKLSQQKQIPTPLSEDWVILSATKTKEQMQNEMKKPQLRHPGIFSGSLYNDERTQAEQHTSIDETPLLKLAGTKESYEEPGESSECREGKAKSISITNQPLSSPKEAQEPPLFPGPPYPVNFLEPLKDDIQKPQGAAKAVFSQYMTARNPHSKIPTSHPVDLGKLRRWNGLQRPPRVKYPAFREYSLYETRESRHDFTRFSDTVHSSAESVYGKLVKIANPMEELFGMYKKIEQQERVESKEAKSPSQFLKLDQEEEKSEGKSAAVDREFEMMEKEFEEWEKDTE